MRAWVEKGAYLSSNATKITKSLRADEIKNILVIRHAALGDMLQTRPFLIELKKCFPNAQVTLSLISNYQYAAPTDLVDHVHVLEGSDLRNTSFIKRAKNFFTLSSFDLLFDLACTSRSKILSFCTSAKLKLSFPYSKNLWLYHVNIHRSDFRFEAENLLEFLFFFGHQPQYPINYGLQIHQETHNEILLFMGASNPNRCYPLDRWELLIELLAKNYPQTKWVILQGHLPQEDYQVLYQKIHKKFDNIVYQTKLDLSNLAKKLLNSKILISSDTGIRHLAIAHGVPTIGFFHNTCPGRNLPTYDKNHLILLDKEQGHINVEDAFKKISAFISSL